MALIKCPECNNDISELAKSCPHCGYRIKNPKDMRNRKILIVSLAALMVLILGIILTKTIINKAQEKKEKQKQEEMLLRRSDVDKAEEFRHTVEVCLYKPEVYEELSSFIRNYQTVYIQLSKTGVEYSVRAPELEEALEDVYGDKLSEKMFKSKVYSAKVFVVTVIIQDEYSTPIVQGTWK